LDTPLYCFVYFHMPLPECSRAYWYFMVHDHFVQNCSSISRYCITNWTMSSLVIYCCYFFCLVFQWKEKSDLCSLSRASKETVYCLWNERAGSVRVSGFRETVFLLRFLGTNPAFCPEGTKPSFQKSDWFCCSVIFLPPIRHSEYWHRDTYDLCFFWNESFNKFAVSHPHLHLPTAYSLGLINMITDFVLGIQDRNTLPVADTAMLNYLSSYNILNSVTHHGN